MTQNNDHDFQQFRGQFDDAMMPDANFKAKMEKLLQSEKPVEAERTSTVLASPPSESSATVIPGRRSHPLMIAAAVITVFAVAVASVWVLSGDVLEGEYASAPSGIATMPADAPGTPGPDVQLTAEKYPGISGVSDFFGMHGGLLIVRAPVDLQENQTDPNQEPNVNSDVLMAVDPDTDEIVWEQPFYGFRAIGSSDDVLIGIENDWTASTPNGQTLLRIVALDLATGEQLWSTARDSSGPSRIHPGLIVINGVVVEVTSDNMLIARNLSDGEVAWETEYDPGEGWLQLYRLEDGTETEEQQYTVAATAWNDTLVIVNGDGIVQLVDAETGDMTIGHQFDWPQPEHPGGKFIELYSMDDGVVLYEQLPEEGGLRSQVTAFDPYDGTYFWQQEVGGQQFVDVADNGNVAMQSVIWEPSNWLQRLLGNQGHTIRSLTWINGSSGEVRLSTEPGRVDEGVPRAATDGNYACSRTGNTEVVCFDPFGTRYIVEIQPRYNFDLVDGVLYVATEDGLYWVQLP